MWFFNSFVKSLYDLNWLRAQRQDLGRAFSYFCLFLFLYVGLTMVPVFINMVRGDVVNALKTGLVQKVPDFTATIKDGELSVAGIEQPYIFKDEGFILVVDTVTTSSLSLDTYLEGVTKAGVLVTKSKGEMYDDSKGQSRSQSWKEFGDVSVNRAQLINLANKFLSKPMMFVYFLFIFAFMYLMIGIGKLFSVLVVSAIMLAIIKISKKQWLFKEIFAVGLFAVTFATIAIELLRIVSPRLSVVAGFLFLGVWILLFWLGAAVLLDRLAPSVTIEEKQ